MKKILFFLSVFMLFSTANAQWNSHRGNTWWFQTEASLDNIFTTGLSDSTAIVFIIGANGDTIKTRADFKFWRTNRYVPQDSIMLNAQVIAYVSSLGYITGISALSGIGDVATYSSLGAGELLEWSGSAWVHQTLGELSLLTQSQIITQTYTQIDSHTVAVTGISKFMMGNSGSGWYEATVAQALDTLITQGTNPTTDATYPIGIDTDDKFIEFFDGTASRVTPAIQIANYVILYPDSVQPRSDDVILAHFPAEIYPHGITLTYVAISASASCSDTHVLEEWSDAVGTSQGTVESLALSTASKVESTTIDDAAIAADAYLNINLDATTDNINQIIVTIGYYVNAGD